jgi:hypothetical protein
LRLGFLGGENRKPGLVGPAEPAPDPATGGAPAPSKGMRWGGLFCPGFSSTVSGVEDREEALRQGHWFPALGPTLSLPLPLRVVELPGKCSPVRGAEPRRFLGKAMTWAESRASRQQLCPRRAGESGNLGAQKGPEQPGHFQESWGSLFLTLRLAVFSLLEISGSKSFSEMENGKSFLSFSSPSPHL